jgi:methionine synthase II (cobalamin-independent)
MEESPMRTVLWTISDDSADTDQVAVMNAFLAMQRQGSIANVFQVVDGPLTLSNKSRPKTYDLQEMLTKDASLARQWEYLAEEDATYYVVHLDKEAIDIRGPFSAFREVHAKIDEIKGTTGRTQTLLLIKATALGLKVSWLN